MKILIKRILFIFIILLSINIVKAEQFKKGEYIEGEYIKMVSKDTSKYLTVQIIRDSNDNFVYCIEPFILVDENETNYTMYEKDLTNYNNLTEEQKRKVSLIAYYGYGYKDRMTKKWYAITQILIWRTVNPESEFYFTDTSNGNKIDKYTGHINEILTDVNRHDSPPTFIKDYIANYKEDLVIDNYKDEYSIKTNYDYSFSNGDLIINQIETNGTIEFEKSNKRVRDVIIYESENSQDLMRAGNVINKKYIINVKVNSGTLTLDIRKDKSNIYTIESDFSNTCYEILNKETKVDQVCTSNNDLVYKTNQLPYGEYVIKQVNIGKGYESDLKEYHVTIDENNKETILVLDNKLIKNEIELVKYYCQKETCFFEENAIFNVYDTNNNLVDSIITDAQGYGSVEVGYGNYTIIQESGIKDYTFVSEYIENITNSNDKYYKELYNYYIEEEIGGFDTETPNNHNNNNKNNAENEVLQPPKTGTKLADFLKILYNVIMIVICYCNFKRFCYNN